MAQEFIKKATKTDPRDAQVSSGILFFFHPLNYVLRWLCCPCVFYRSALKDYITLEKLACVLYMYA